MYNIESQSDTALILMLQSIAGWRLLNPGERAVVAVSGGPDSTALLALFCDLAQEWNLDLTAAHLDHGINRELGDVVWLQTQDVAERLGVKWIGKREDVLQRQRQEGGSLHQVARRLRYQFFASVASQVGATVIATGHTMDDQAETVLMRIIRGTGALGACGIPPKRKAGSAAIIRPLLAHRRMALAALCRERNLPYVDDPANVEASFLRSRVRHEVLPLLEKVFGHEVVPHIAAFAERLREDQEALDEQVKFLVDDPRVRRTSTAFTFPRALLESKPPSLQKLFLLKVLEALHGKTPRLKAVHLDAVVDATAREGSGRRIILPESWEVFIGASTVRIGRFSPPVPPMEPVVLRCPGSTDVPDLGVRVHVEKCRTPPSALPPERGQEAYFRTDAVRGGLTLRTRKPGDAIVPLGGPGRRKLKKVLIDRKIPRDWRDRVPIITTSGEKDEEILWAVGVVLGENCRVSEYDEEMWYVRVEPLKEEADSTVE